MVSGVMQFSFNWSLPHDPSVAVKVKDWMRVAMYYMVLGLPGLCLIPPKQDI